MASKRLIVCLDGTWNRADEGGRHTNVVSIMRAIAPEGQDGKTQIVYYDAGVGTGGAVDRLTGGLTGSGIRANIRDAYIFLGNNWEEGDEIFVFGFSRGAFTARSLVGFIAACGLLDRKTLGRIDKAWKAYRQGGAARRKALKAEFGARDVRIEAVGVWDTVGSLGIPVRWFNPLAFLARRHRFHNTGLTPLVRCAFHAVAVDEKRGAFAPTLWEKEAGRPLPLGQVVEQVWFAGAHSDVGGGYEKSTLAPISLGWMVSRLQACTGLTFRDGWESGAGAADPCGPMHDPRSLLYLTSRWFPFERVIGGHAGWTRRLLPSRNLPKKGHEFVNEALHPSVLLRWDQETVTLRGSARKRGRYRPRNVEAARTTLPTAGVDIVDSAEARLAAREAAVLSSKRRW